MSRSHRGASGRVQGSDSWLSSLAQLLIALAILLLAFGFLLLQASRPPSSSRREATEVFLLDTEGRTVFKPAENRFGDVLSELKTESLQRAAAGETQVLRPSGGRQVTLQAVDEKTPATIAAIVSSPPEQGPSGGVATVPLLVASALLLALFGVIAATILRRATHLISATPEVPQDREPNLAPRSRPDRNVFDQRSKLIKTCISVYDLMTSEAQREQLRMTLEEVGLTVVEVRSGDRFDPDTQKAIDTVVTSDPRLNNTVAETERPGYKDGDKVLRLPEVLVYRTGG